MDDEWHEHGNGTADHHGLGVDVAQAARRGQRPLTLSEAIVQFLDVREHMHGRLVLTAVMRPCSVTELAVTG